MNVPKVSIIICTYNRSHLLKYALQSALSQDFGDYEVIVVDDGSTDETPRIVSGFDDERIRYVYKNNAGLAAARNTGIDIARGTYISFLDDDDLYLPHKLSAHLAFMEDNPTIGWTSGGYLVEDLRGNSYGEQNPWRTHPQLGLETWLFWCPTIPDAVMVRRDWLELAGGFDEGIRGPEDWDLWLRLAEAGCDMVWIPEIVVTYRIHVNSMSRISSVVYGDEGGYLAVLDKFYAEHEDNEAIMSLRNAAYAQAYLKRAAANYRDGNYETGQQSLLHALDLDPALGRNKGKQALDFILAEVTQPLTAGPMEFARSVAKNLPDDVWSRRDVRRLVMGRSAAALFFSAAKKQQWATVQRMFLNLVKYDVTWLGNRGVWSILIQSVRGRMQNSWSRSDLL